MDATMMRITYIYGGGCEELTVASAYLPHDSDEPQPIEEVRDITDYCHSGKNKLIIGCDANSHLILWGGGISVGYEPEYSQSW
jgi:hypothetical protein